MPNFRVARRVDAPAAAAWDLLTDARRWPEWGPTVRGVDGPARLVDGTTGHVIAPLGLRLPFAASVDAAGRRWSWRIGPVPATTHEVEELPDGSCRVSFGVPLWALPYGLVCEVALRRIAALLEPEAGRA